MEISVEVTSERIEDRWIPPGVGTTSGAVLEFRGIVRDEEAGRKIQALRYEAYRSMAERQMREILARESALHACERTVVIHRDGWIPVGSVAILVWIESRHRGEGIALLAAFMDVLKRDVPIWKVESR